MVISNEMDKCPLTCNVMENESTAITTPASGAAPIQKIFIMRVYTPVEFIVIAAKFQ